VTQLARQGLGYITREWEHEVVVHLVLVGATCARRPCETMTGRVAMATTSSIVWAEACARSTIIPRDSIRAMSCLPFSVRPPFFTPLADPPMSLNLASERVRGDRLRDALRGLRGKPVRSATEPLSFRTVAFREEPAEVRSMTEGAA